MNELLSNDCRLYRLARMFVNYEFNTMSQPLYVVVYVFNVKSIFNYLQLIFLYVCNSSLNFYD